ncbi:MAG: serine hydrolase domain-containing protein [Acidobacteriota bacterium]
MPKSAFIGVHASDDQFSPVRAFIQKQMLERQVPSVAVAVARDGKIIWEEAGWANREERIAATPHTMYSLASISKTDYRHGADDSERARQTRFRPPAQRLSGRRQNQSPARQLADLTVRRVANHSSGLPLHYQFFYEMNRSARPRGMKQSTGTPTPSPRRAKKYQYPIWATVCWIT